MMERPKWLRSPGSSRIATKSAQLWPAAADHSVKADRSSPNLISATIGDAATARRCTGLFQHLPIARALSSRSTRMAQPGQSRNWRARPTSPMVDTRWSQKTLGDYAEATASRGAIDLSSGRLSVVSG